MTSLTYTESLTVVHCTCGMPYAIPHTLYQRALEKRGPRGVEVCCPVGHYWHFTGKTDAEILAEEKAALEQRNTRLSAALDQAQAEAQAQVKRANAYKGEVTKIKKRTEKGVCPVPGCKRSFVDVARHVASKHPGVDHGDLA